MAVTQAGTTPGFAGITAEWNGKRASLDVEVIARRIDHRRLRRMKSTTNFQSSAVTS